MLEVTSRIARLLAFVALSVACTPEATEVDPGPRGGGGSPTECAPVESPRPGCTECLNEACAAEIAACEGTDCTCRRFGAQQGQINCLLACRDLRQQPSHDACARECGFGSVNESDPRTRALWECLLDVPGGPPVCRMCLAPLP